MANPNVPNPKGFYEGRLSFYMAPHFGDRVVALAEPNFEVSQLDGTVNVDIERLQTRLCLQRCRDALGQGASTPLTDTGIPRSITGRSCRLPYCRPRFLDFEDSGGILPAHMVGLWGTGKDQSWRTGKFTYDWFVGNGPKIADAQPVVNPIVTCRIIRPAAWIRILPGMTITAPWRD